MRIARPLFSLCLWLMPLLAQAAGLRLIDVPADADGPALRGAVWYPCATPPGAVQLGRITLPGVQDCPASGDGLPLIVISHGKGGDFTGHHDTAEALADAGFAVAAISHPGDTVADLSRVDDLSVLVERPTDIKRLIDFMLRDSPLAARIDARRVGFFGFSRGGYTGLVLIGADPDWPSTIPLCHNTPGHMCQQVLRHAYPTWKLTHDPRIGAAVIADPLAVMFTAGSFAGVKVPVQLWASEKGGDGVSPQSVAAVDRALPAEHTLHAVPNSQHFAFLTPCPPALAAARPALCTDPPGFDHVAFHRLFDAEMVSFFRGHLPQQTRQ